MKKLFFAILLSFIIVFSAENLTFANVYIDGGVYQNSSAPLLTDTITYINTYEATVGNPMFFRLIPTINDTYTIQTTGTVDTEGELYDAGGNSLDVQDDVVGTNFLISRVLNAGETYYLRVINYTYVVRDPTTLQITAASGGGLQAAPIATVKPITGTLQVGETLTGNYTYSDVNGDLEGTSTYKWYRADNSSGLNKTEIAGATATTYVLTSSDEGKYIAFEVTPVALTGTAQGIAVLSGWTGAVVPAEAAPTATVQAITGTLKVGETLTGNYTYSDVNGDLEGTSTYKWYRADNSSGLNKNEISGATAITYVLQSEDIGKYISFEVTPVALTGIIQGIAVESEKVGSIVGDATAPSGYSIVIGQMFINNSNKTAMSFTFSGAEIGAAFNYTVSSSGGGTITGSGTITSANDQITGINTTSLSDGTLTLSITLTDTAGNIGEAATDTVSKDATAPSGYSVAINQASLNNSNKTAMSFTFSGAEVGAAYNYTVSSSGGGIITGSGTITSANDQITGINTTSLSDGTLTLSVALTDTAGNTGEAATDTVSKNTIVEAAPTATVQPITGTLQAGETLTGHYTYSDVNGDLQGTSTFKWYRADNLSGLNKTEIAGATATTYVLTSSDEGKYIAFEVTPVALTGTAQGIAVLSGWTGAIVPAEAAPTATVQAITGTLQVGETLMGNYTYSDVNGDLEGTSTYKWYRSDNSSGLNKAVIAGATAKTYVLQSADEGKYISFEVTPVALTGTTQGTAVLSTWTGAVVPAEAAPTATVQPITGTLQVGKTLTGHYTYSDVNGDLQGTSTYKWYRADNSSGLNKTEIAGATAKTYVLQSADEGKYISFEVTPVALTGTTQGTAVESARTGAVAGAAPTPTPTPTPLPVVETVKEQITVDITDGQTGNTIANTLIERTTEKDGSKKDLVTYEADKAKETIDKLIEQGKDTARLIVPDKKDEVSEAQINIPKGTISALGQNNIKLEISTENVMISIPKESVKEQDQKSNEDIYFRVVPIKEESQREEIIERAIQQSVVIQAVSSNNLEVIGRPMTIETNMKDKDVDIILPLKDAMIPMDPKEREAYLSCLGIFIEHSDGEKVLKKGEVVDLGNGLLGIKFRISKFSTFTVLKLDKDLAAAESKPVKKVFLVATNLSYADAYAGEVLAKKLGAQIIKVGAKDKDLQSFIQNVVKNYTINDQIFILGGKLAANINLENQLKAKGFNSITRIGGVDLYETAKKISEKIAPKKGTPVILVNGSALRGYSDSISKAAAEKGYAILFVKKNSLTNYTLSALTKIAPSKIYIAGTSNHISNSVILELKKKLKINAQSIVRIKSANDIK